MSSKDVNKNLSTEIGEALKKLSANIYYDKTNLSMRYMLAPAVGSGVAVNQKRHG